MVLGETHALLINGYCHMLVLVSVNSDDQLNRANEFATGLLLSFLPPERWRVGQVSGQDCEGT